MDIESYEDYWKRVRELAKIELDETTEYALSNDMDLSLGDAVNDAALYAVENDPNFLVYHKREIIFYNDSGFGDPGWSQFEHWQPETGSGFLKKLAQIGLYNDIWKAYNHMLDARESLGDAVPIAEDYIWAEGQTFTFTHEKGTQDPVERDFILESFGDGQWQVYDHNGEHFENISPDVHFEQGDWVFPSIALNKFLNNICNRRLNKLAYQSA